MFQYFRKYRHFFAIGLMGFYLAGGLQFPILECLHFFTHLDDLAAGKYDSHQFHAHGNNHAHHSLAVLDTVLDNTKNDESPVNETSDSSVNKFPQLVHFQKIELTGFLENTYSDFAFLNNLKNRHPSVLSPPPRV